MESLSIHEARKLILLSQKLPWTRPRGRALDATLDTVRHLGYVQIDTISVVERAHHHTLWNRNRRYRNEHLDRLLQQRSIFEYWSHAAAYLPMEDFRFSLPRKRAIAGGERHWYRRDPKMMREVLARIEAEGPLLSRDFEDPGAAKMAMWERKPAKRALEQLFMEGRLMTLRREGFNKVYDLTERVLPEGVDTRMPDRDEFVRHLVDRFLDAHGPGRAAEIAYLRKGLRPDVERTIQAMREQGELLAVTVRGEQFLVKPDTLALLDRQLSRQRLRILSPFDNLVIQRNRMVYFFDFDYQIECYTPAHKRRYGYFCLPLLWDGRLLGRVDCKAERGAGTLQVRSLALEDRLQKREAFIDALGAELRHFAAFNGCDRIEIADLADRKLAAMLRCAVY